MHEAAHDRAGFRLVSPAKQWAGGGTPRKLSLVSVNDDYLLCNPFGPDGTPLDINLYVMKPWTLRRTPWDGTGPDASGISYAYTSDSARNATMGSVTESQLITPNYNTGDIVYAILASETFRLTNGKSTSLMDLNLDGRAWAHLASP